MNPTTAKNHLPANPELLFPKKNNSVIDSIANSIARFSVSVIESSIKGGIIGGSFGVFGAGVYTLLYIDQKINQSVGSKYYISKEECKLEQYQDRLICQESIGPVPFYIFAACTATGVVAGGIHGALTHICRSILVKDQ